MRLRDANILIRAVLGRRVPRLLPANDTWVWNSETTAWTQLQPANSPSARFGVLLVKDPMLKQWVLFGGSLNGTLTTATHGSGTARTGLNSSPPIVPSL
jgi:hypothetical protein